MRSLFVAFLTLGALEQLQDTRGSSERFLKGYKTFQTSFKTKTSIKFHSKISHDEIEQHGEDIIKYCSYAIIGLGLLSLVFCSYMFIPLSLIFLLEQIIYRDFINLSKDSEISAFKELAFTLLIFFVGLGLSCSGPCKTMCPKVTNRGNFKRKRK